MYEPGNIHYTMHKIDDYLDYLFNAIYFCEFLCKSVTMGLYLDKNCYLSVGWNKLDFIIVLASINEMVMLVIAGGP